jgi:hypothetical protein
MDLLSLESKIEELLSKLHCESRDSLISQDYATWFYYSEICKIMEPNRALFLTSTNPHLRQLATLFTKLEEPPKHSPVDDYPYPLTIIQDRYGGVYSGGSFVAFKALAHEISPSASGSDLNCCEFFCETPIPYGVGETPDEAIIDLKSKLTNRIASNQGS